jgi:hypothetical protein
MTKRIFRVTKNENYTVIHNGFLKNRALSWGAKGLFTHILSLPDHWNIRLEELCSHSKNGISATRGFYKELVEAGYIYKTTGKDAEGKFYHEYTIYEEPNLNPKFSEELATPPAKTVTRFPSDGKPPAENLNVVNTKEESTESYVDIEPQAISENSESLIPKPSLEDFLSQTEKIFQTYYDKHLGGKRFLNNDIWSMQNLFYTSNGDIELISDRLLRGWRDDNYFGIRAQNIPPTPKKFLEHINRLAGDSKPIPQEEKLPFQYQSTKKNSTAEKKENPNTPPSPQKIEYIQEFRKDWLIRKYHLTEQFFNSNDLVNGFLSELRKELKGIHLTDSEYKEIYG